MDLTRRGWAAAACVVALAVGASLLASPLLLAAAAGLAAWILGSQLSFVTALRRERNAVTASVTGPAVSTGVGETIELSFTASSDGPLPSELSIDIPAAARPVDDDSTALTLHLGAAGDEARAGDNVTAETTISLEWPVAGRYRIGPPQVTLSDPQGLFVAEFEASATTEVHVRSREPDTTHLGQGDDRIAVFGEHNTGRRGPGTEPAELRPYNPGDDFSKIDWNATARLRDAYVTESDAETDRRTVLFVDHRSTAGEGPPGSTPLAYLRYAGLALVESARNLGDPLGCYAVGDEGVTVEHPPSHSPGQYDTIAESIQSLRSTEKHSTEVARGSPANSRSQVPASTPSEESPGSVSASTDGAYSADSAANVTAGIGRPANMTSDPARAAELASRLATEDSPFANHLNPLLDDATPYLHRVADEPLFQAARTFLERIQGSVWSVILTDGEHPGELRETVKLARRGNNTVLVVLASPTLFRPGLTDLNERRQTYEELVEFANSLTAMDRVTVRELAPGDIAEAVLSAGGERT